MRTIKFRGKRLDGQGWVVGYPLEKFQEIDGEPRIVIDTCRTFANDGYHSLEQYEVLPESVGQWTGLVDRHGNEIYEGDVVGFEDATQTEGGAYEQNCIGVVEWGEETASFEVTNRLSAESWEVLCECVVIGSIHDNPELMEV